MEDFNRLRLLAKQIARTNFKLNWQFRIEVIPPSGFSKPPADFDIYVKDITYDPIEIETETEKIGGHTVTWPISLAPVTLTMTMRDNVDGRIRDWFGNISGGIVNKDGTVNLVRKSLCKVIRYGLVSTSGGISEENIGDTLLMIPTKLGEISESRGEGGNVEFPITFVEHSTQTQL